VNLVSAEQTALSLHLWDALTDRATACGYHNGISEERTVYSQGLDPYDAAEAAPVLVLWPPVALALGAFGLWALRRRRKRHWTAPETEKIIRDGCQLSKV